MTFEGGWKHLRTPFLRLNLLRGFGIVLSNLCFFTALSSMPMGKASAIFFVSPLLITLLSVFLIREKVERSNWIAVLVGLLIIIRPGFLIFNPVSMFPLMAALFYALVQIAAR